MAPVSIPENCLNCGVCCFSKSGTYVPVTEEDWVRLGDDVSDWARTVGGKHYMRMEDGHCQALQITTRRGELPVFYCAIYEKRPQVCRFITRGKSKCQAELDAKADKVAAFVRR